MDKTTPKRLAKLSLNSNDLIFNPYKTGSKEHTELANELLRLTTKDSNNA